MRRLRWRVRKCGADKSRAEKSQRARELRDRFLVFTPQTFSAARSGGGHQLAEPKAIIYGVCNIDHFRARTPSEIKTETGNWGVGLALLFSLFVQFRGPPALLTRS